MAAVNEVDGCSARCSQSPPAPVAICGIALRLPGGIRSPEQFWDVLYNGKDTRSTIPADRFRIDAWDDRLGKKGHIKTHYGYFIDEDLACLDTSFFSMTKQEVEKSDPQQRLMLEVARECFDSAGEHEYRGKSIGCYIGTFGEDWLYIQSKENQLTGQYNFTGDLMIANRLSYEYDLKGPSLVIKTGCSASLISVHEACRALQSGDCTGAIAGGTSLLMGPTIFSSMTKENIISPDGSCRTFDADANGFARAEAINAIYLKLLDDAIRDGNPIRAVIRSSGTNCDGKSQGVMTPSSSAQEALIRKVYDDAGISPGETAFVECHGTGTPVGDPLEARAVAKIFGEKGVYIGSSKPNVGHSEGASGLTGLIKAVLAIENNTIPPNIKFEKPNPQIPFSEANLVVPVKPVAWPEGRTKRISVNSFGIGGTNAHIIVESLENFRPTLATTPPVILPSTNSGCLLPQLLLISGNSPDGVKQYADRLLQYQRRHPDRSPDLAYTLSQRREHLPQRAFTITMEGKSRELSPIVTSPLQQRPLVLLFSGQGAQWPQMGKELIEFDTSFRDDIRSMDAFLSQIKHPPNWKIEEELLRPERSSNIHRAHLSQPLCTAIQIGLVNTFKRIHINPDAVIGHSSGEISAAYASGALSMREAIINSYYRGFVTQEHQLRGGMAAIGLDGDAVAPYLLPGVVVAAENSFSSCTISGDLDRLEDVLAAIKKVKPDAFARKLRVDMAYHSHHMNMVADRYLSLIKDELGDGGKVMQKQLLPMFSTVTAAALDKAINPAYWAQNLTSPVKFCAGIMSLLKAMPHAVFLEIGPHSQLAGALRQICNHMRAPYAYVPSMIRGKDCTEGLLSAFGQLWQQHVPWDFAKCIPRGNVLPDLPAYPWDHSAKFWFEPRMSREWRFRQHGHHALLGQRVTESSAIEPAWRNVLDLEDEAWLEDHKLRGDIIFPFVGYLCMAGEAVRQVSGINAGYRVKHAVASTALVLRENTPVEVLTTFRRKKLTDTLDSEYWDFTICSHSGSTWIKHCQGSVIALDTRPRANKPPSQLPRKVSGKRLYQAFGRVGLICGPAFRGIVSMEASSTERRAKAEISPRPQIPGLTEEPFLLHPATMDSCLQLLIAAETKGIMRKISSLVVPTLIEEVDVFPPGGVMVAEAWMSQGFRDVGVDCLAGGDVVLRLRGARLTPLRDDMLTFDNDRHAAARLVWYPHVDFLDKTMLIDLPRASSQAIKALEEITLLAILDSSDRIERLVPGQPHYDKYRNWLSLERQRASSGSYPPIVESPAKYLNFAPNARATEILRRADQASQDPSAASAVEGTLRIWNNIEDLFTGKQDVLSLLLKDQVLARFYDAISLDFSRLVKALTIAKPTLRIMEVGAGTGGTTEILLRGLLGMNTNRANPPYSVYTFTDISVGFFPKAAERFSYAPNMEYRVLDISQSPLSQGYEAGTYDLILAANVVHATPSLHDTLSNLRVLLSPGGDLVLTEICALARTPSFIFGNFSGWWMGETDNRKWEPYVSVDRWDEELRRAGFTGVDTAVLDNEQPYHISAAIMSRLVVNEPIPNSSSITVLCEDANNREGTTHRLISSLKSHGITVTVTKFGDLPSPDHPILAMLDFEGFFFAQITRERFILFQELCRRHQGQKLLWLLPPSSITSTDPRWAQSLGALRAVQAELGVPFYSLEISPDEEHFADIVLKVLQRVCETKDLEALRPDREFVVHDGLVKVGRFEPFSLEDEICEKTRPSSGAVKISEIGSPGMMETLRWSERGQLSLGPDEVEIRTKAVGINFRDILIAMGVLASTEQVGPSPLGVEASGVVCRVGRSVTHLKPGDRVVGLAPDSCLATHVVFNSLLCKRIPENLSFVEAASLPSVYATCLGTLLHIGQLEAGQSVLIHSACGGIGHAAVEICKMLGAEIFVTVGSEWKVKYAMETYGLTRNHIFNSRDDSFVADLMRETRGAGVDIVLNSLSGQLLHASWECVAEFGKMIEIGKRDLLDSGHLALGPFLKSRSYSCFDLVHNQRKRPAFVGKLLDQVIRLFEDGKIHPVKSLTVFDAADIERAFRHLQTGQNIGKSIIRMPDDPSTINSVPHSIPITFRPDASYLLTGGLGGLGKPLALWMVERGARSLVFLSRSAGEKKEDKDFLAELESMGCLVTAVQGKANDIGDVQASINEAPKPIKGVIHLAMELHDGQLTDLSWEDWTRTIAPKADGAWNLHKALKGVDVDFFVMTSSVTTCYDQTGQGNYIAANCFLEAFCRWRRLCGLPAAVINLAPIDDVGYVSENPQLRKKARAQGWCLMTERETLDYFELALLNQFPSVNETEASQNLLTPKVSSGQVIMAIRSEVHLDNPECLTVWKRDRRMGTYHNIPDKVSSASSGTSSALKAFLAEAAEDLSILATEASTEYLAVEIGRTIFAFLMKDEANVDTGLTMAQMGMDSLMAVELARWWKQTFKVDISTLEILGSGTLRSLGKLAAEMVGQKLAGTCDN